MLIVTDEPGAEFFVSTSLIFVLCMAVLLFIFVPKIRRRKESVSDRIKEGIRNQADLLNNQSSFSLRKQQPSSLAETSAELQLQRENELLRHKNEELEKQLSELKALVPSARVGKQEHFLRESLVGGPVGIPPGPLEEDIEDDPP